MQMQMRVKRTLLPAILALALATGLYSQSGRRPSVLPQVTVESYDIRLTLDPDPHEFKAVAAIKFKPVETTDVVVFQMNENLSASKVTDERNENLDFSQDDPGPGNVSVRFPKPLNAGNSVTIKMEYTGGFDLDRYSRNFSRDQSSAYIGTEGSYLLYPAKWFPVGKLFGDRPEMNVMVTVPLGMTAVGPGTPQPIVTQDTTETFGWNSRQPVAAASIVAGRFFERKVQFETWSIDTFAREDHIEAIRKTAEALVKPLEYYRQLFGDPAAGTNMRLVEVDDRLALQPGTLGTIYITHRELNETMPLRALARRAAYQWWMDTVGVKSADDLWLADGMAYYSAALFLGNNGGPQALRDEIDNLAVLGLKYESKAAIRNGLSLGYGSDLYQSVVAGKGAYVLNMLQGIIGPAKFSELMQAYVKQAASTGGSTAEFQKMAERAYGKELAWFFAEWIDTTGVPNFQIDYTIYKTRDGFRVSGTVKQDRDLFRMPVEIEAQGEGKVERVRVDLNGKSTPFDVNTFSQPEKVIVDLRQQAPARFRGIAIQGSAYPGHGTQRPRGLCRGDPCVRTGDQNQCQEVHCTLPARGDIFRTNESAGIRQHTSVTRSTATRNRSG